MGPPYTSFFIKDRSDPVPDEAEKAIDGEIDPPTPTLNKKQPSDAEIQQKFAEILKHVAIIDHERLFGVEDELQRLKSLLSIPDGSWIISLFGEGGIGKTALAYEAVSRYAVAAKFTRLAWVSAKQRHLSQSLGFRTERDTNLQWADLVKQMADQLNIGLGYSRNMWGEEFRIGLKRLPPGEKCLIIVDNLETIEELSVVQYFDSSSEPRLRLVNPHKLLVTTRKTTLGQAPNVEELTISGLNPGSAFQFIRELGKGNNAIRNSPEEELEPIITVTEGNPLLIKLVVRRFLHARKPLARVLQELREDLGTKGIAEDVRNYLYVQSLEELQTSVGEDSASQIMNAFCPRPAGEQLTYEELRRYSGIDDPDMFEKARQVACDLSLIRVSSVTTETQYSIHSLLWQFTCQRD